KIDINVHPTKTEIKYQDEKAIYAIIRSAVKRSLGRYNITPTLDFNQETGFDRMITPKALDEINPPKIRFNADFNPFANEKSSDREIPFLRNAGENWGIPTNWDTLYEVAKENTLEQTSMELSSNHEFKIDEESAVETVNQRQVFQIHQRYIISQLKSGF